MKRVNVVLSALALCVVGFISCEKEVIKNNLNSKPESKTQKDLEFKLNKNSNDALEYPNQLVAFPKLNYSYKIEGVSAIVSVGVNPNLPTGYFHNDALDYIIERRNLVDPNSILPSVVQLTKDYMNSMSEISISDEIRESYDLPPSDETVETLGNEVKRINEIGYDNYIHNQSVLSANAINFTNEMLDDVSGNLDSNSTLGFTQIFTEFEARTILSFNLTFQEKNIILHGIATGRYSSLYWFNVRNNPENAWNDPLDSGEPQALGKFWKRLLDIVVADIKGAVAGGTAGAFFGVPQAGAVVGAAVFSADEGFNGGDV